MLEAATQAGAWLVRMTEDYKHSIVVLSEARAVKYADFVTPGHMLTMRVEQTDEDERFIKMKFQGEVEGRTSVSGRIILERYNLAEQDPTQADLDSRMLAYQRNAESLLTHGLEGR
jgi:3-hydroxyacyl-[acyl-carrier-protein] dehydratase